MTTEPRKASSSTKGPYRSYVDVELDIVRAAWMSSCVRKKKNKYASVPAVFSQNSLLKSINQSINQSVSSSLKESSAFSNSLETSHQKCSIQPIDRYGRVFVREEIQNESFGVFDFVCGAGM